MGGQGYWVIHHISDINVKLFRKGASGTCGSNKRRVYMRRTVAAQGEVTGSP